MFQQLMDEKDFLAFTLANIDKHIPQHSFTLSNQTTVKIIDNGVISFTPYAGSTKDIVLSCAVHGNETAPIEICNELIQALLEEKIQTVHRVLFLIGNPESILTETRFVEENMNRLFSGAHSMGEGLCNKERIRAKNLEDYVRDFFVDNKTSQRIHYDLHTAIKPSKHEKFAIYPFRPGRSFSQQQIMFLAGCDVDTILFHHEPTTTFSYYSSEQFQADAFTVELGKVMPFGQNDMKKFANTRKMMNQLITQHNIELEAFDSNKVNLYKVSRSVNKHFDDFSFSFPKSTVNFTGFEQGQTLATEGGQEIVIEYPYEAIVFPNENVPVGQRTVLCLIPAPNEDIQ
ncbi:MULTISPECIES: succinylglutamate desuccinylase [Shewanella]|uniref:succinylglutamate desuccinylase n=1 Tax=Shewanella TaxID=22 RepID=UPI001BC14049|nr:MULTISPECIES: succinylglutamate desuccinylase [Shewanella]GIU53022.1 succinylglutamate desuccinylase [Shewanella sp. KT0246]